MKDLIVHVGPYKTGSTAIQKVLAASRRGLESASILYPTSRKTQPLEAHHSLARFMRTGPGPGISLVFGPDELAATLRSTRADYVVLSSEGFSNPKLAATNVAALEVDPDAEPAEVIDELASYSNTFVAACKRRT